MRILSISDRPESRFEKEAGRDSLQEIDLILSCGDLPPEYLSLIASRSNSPLYYVRGNHDIRYESKPPYGCFDLHARMTTVDGIRILGIEGSRWYNGGPVQYTEHQMRMILLKLLPYIWLKKGVDIVITHAPPRYIHDAEDICHQGFVSFRWLMRLFAPFYFIHGHIHAHFNDRSERISTYHRTQVVNTYGHFIFEIDPTRLAH